MKDQITSVAHLKGGAAMEMLDDVLREIVQDILDPNTNALSARSVTLTISIKPDETRETGAVTLTVSKKLGGREPQATRLYFGKKNGAVVAVESSLRQRDFFAATDEAIQPGAGPKINTNLAHIGGRK